MNSILLAAAFTFTATATGVEKGTPLEFLFAGINTDRDYETMFLLDSPVDTFLSDLEKAGFPRGVPTDSRTCQLWPVGAVVNVKPDILTSVDRELPEGVPAAPFIYTGGTRFVSGTADAATNMPASVMSLYSLSQSPFVYNGIFEQGVVYGSHKAKIQLKKGERYTFTLSCDPATLPLTFDCLFTSENVTAKFKELKEHAKEREISVQVRFSDDLTVNEATAIATALSTIDSPRVKINGRADGALFYRAFLPLVKWTSRQDRLTQPFEIHLGKSPRILFIEEDWSGEGNDPKLIEKVISYKQMSSYDRTDTVFFYVQKDTPVKIVQDELKKLPKSVINHYVFCE